MKYIFFLSAACVILKIPSETSQSQANNSVPWVNIIPRASGIHFDVAGPAGETGWIPAAWDNILKQLWAELGRH